MGPRGGDFKGKRRFGTLGGADAAVAEDHAVLAVGLDPSSAELLGGFGPQAENDLAVIGAVCGSLLAGDRLMLDANQAWDVDGTMDGALYEPGLEPVATKA